MPFINCPRCGKPISNRAVQCPNCGFQFGPTGGIYSKDALQGKIVHPCPECGSINITYQTINEPIKTSWLMIIGYIILALTCCGLLVLIPILLQQKNRLVTYATCNECGCHWDVNSPCTNTNQSVNNGIKKEGYFTDYIMIIIAGLIILLIIIISAILLKK